MTVRVVLATGNLAKVAELRRILAAPPAIEGVILVDPRELDLPDVAETGETFQANALLKARAAMTATGLASVADDSGLVVDALGGEPGLHSARYAGTHGDDKANLRLLLERMRGITERSARFTCAAALVAPDGREWTTSGSLEGTLTEMPRGTGGFGYDPVLQPLGGPRTTAEMTAEEKDAISHRGQAFRALRPYVAEL